MYIIITAPPGFGLSLLLGTLHAHPPVSDVHAHDAHEVAATYFLLPSPALRGLESKHIWRHGPALVEAELVGMR